MKKFKLSRPIKDAIGESEVTEINIKSEDDISACDFYDVSFAADGNIKLGTMSGAIANITGLTDEQVGSMSPKDYIELSGIVGKYIL